jgi:plasmid stability protein
VSNVQIRNVPEGLHRRLKARAALKGTTVSDRLLRELERFMSRPTKGEVLARLAGRRPVSTTESSAEAVNEGRQDQCSRHVLIRLVRRPPPRSPPP